MINCKSDLKEYLAYEKQNYGISNYFDIFKLCISGNELSCIWRFQKRLRITEYYKNTNHKLFYVCNLMYLHRLQNKYGLHINCNNCGKGLKIMHLGPILMNGNVQIGENVALHINTAFVAQGVSNEVPRLGNNVVVGVGATILGGVELADGIAVGANALVNKSFLEEDIAIAGVPARKVSNNGRKNWNKK